MSVETLIRGRAKEHIEATDRAEKESGHPTRSPVYIVAATFWRKGQEGLLKLQDRLDSAKIRVNTEREDFHLELPEGERKGFILNFAAVIFGICMVNIEQAIVERAVSISQMTREYNASFRNTFVPQEKSVDEEKETITIEHQQKLIRLADPQFPQPDRTLATIFTDHYDLMPQAIKELLEKTKTLEHIRTWIIPAYEAATLGFIQENARGMDTHGLK